MKYSSLVLKDLHIDVCMCGWEDLGAFRWKPGKYSRSSVLFLHMYIVECYVPRTYLGLLIQVG